MADIQTLQAIAATYGRKNEAERILFQLLDFQNKCSFDVIFYPTYFSFNPSSAVLQDSSTAMDQNITRLHIQSISIPSFNSLEFENADREQYAKALTRATEITFSFIETEQAAVRDYMRLWTNLIYYYDLSQRTYVFRDDQYAAKKNAKIFLLSGLGYPTTVYLTVTGMRPKAIGELTLAQDDQEPYKIDVTFHCDRIDWSF